MSVVGLIVWVCGLVGATVEDLRTLPPTVTVERAAKLAGISRGVAYEQARRFLASGGQTGLPCRRLGRRLLVPTALLLAWLGIEDGRS